MIIITKIDTYRDGGTIGVTCPLISFGVKRFKDVEVCLNSQMGGGDQKLYMGYPKRDKSNLITDQEIIDGFLKELKDHRDRTVSYIDRVLETYKE